MKVESTWSIREPRKYPTGFEYVFVNGKPALSNGEKTKIFNGNVIRFHFRSISINYICQKMFFEKV